MIARIRKSLDEKEKGFTLIELLVVIIIIGILAAIAIPVFLNQRKKAVDASIKSDVRTVATELETYYTDNQAYPATVTATTAVANTMTITTASPFTLTMGNIVSYKIIGTDKYCVYGENGNGTGGAGKGFSYLSGSGGLQPGAAAAKAAGC
ncbi:prepilin-type N-terminal cleavage/methylation domain-containing protein [Pengzhenrongella phosphoraccumulans]|uniref:prepilin-type N-terminal cleavage/methylation domain-containing protein n=1 Tax=Pengzhenrongella phosphoraccumulans TaxID=3114394 RepID=UPI00388DA826